MFGKVPTISIDKTDGCQIYLSPDSLDVEVVSSKSSEMNILIPAANGDFVSSWVWILVPSVNPDYLLLDWTTHPWTIQNNYIA